MDKKIELIAPGGTDKLRIADCIPEAPGPGELRIRHEGIGVNFIDIYQRTGLYPLPLPAVPGVEGAGIVEAVGEGVDSGVDSVAVGDRVVYAGIPGAYAATRLLPAWRAVKLPGDIGTQRAAASFLRGLTVHMLMTRVCPPLKESVLLVHAAAGGLGTTLTRWAKDAGHTVIATVGSEAKARMARANGADHVIAGRDADFAAEVGRLTEGQGVDWAVDGIGGTTMQKTLGCVRRFGTVASIGQAAGPIPPLRVEELGPVRSLMLSRPSVMAYAAEQETYRTAAQAVIAAIRKGIVPEAGEAYRLVDAARAQGDLEAGRTAGSPVLVP
ncbi:quinone oxidoreductase family protein [Novosphingobium beihaiensis]|uniref:Quinone oxidoreductase n=1 Tax=Novosphingobium beihaiensis TaxID=2930389 RepID=A0ABT0BU59_9SPHN|nr:quinone oxidoreductase [Novosphingobium beihaiensis]MCJ2188584.1 quinone oxidoreductase [Novosphingobium beihaiensis]